MAFARPGGLGGRQVRLRLRKQPATADRQMDEMGWDDDCERCLNGKCSEGRISTVAPSSTVQGSCGAVMVKMEQLLALPSPPSLPPLWAWPADTQQPSASSQPA